MSPQRSIGVLPPLIFVQNSPPEKAQAGRLRVSFSQLVRRSGDSSTWTRFRVFLLWEDSRTVSETHITTSCPCCTSLPCLLRQRGMQTLLRVKFPQVYLEPGEPPILPHSVPALSDPCLLLAVLPRLTNCFEHLNLPSWCSTFCPRFMMCYRSL